jgi:hypothetical protein
MVWTVDIPFGQHGVQSHTTSDPTETGAETLAGLPSHTPYNNS